MIGRNAAYLRDVSSESNSRYWFNGPAANGQNWPDNPLLGRHSDCCNREGTSLIQDPLERPALLVIR
eukprot:952425-Prorocentrum_lima.AAC.1